jgi:S-methylmethionine-dependent homocysteine/selenocysteine methylase
VHRDYISAGADVLTANNYAVTPPILARAGLEDRLEELTLIAVDLARKARDEAGARVRIAGSVPPLNTSYRADLVGEDGAILADYRRIVSVLAPHVDLLLCETMSCAREAVAAARAARETDREVWVSWTLQGNWPDHLPSGESLQEAFEAVAHLGVDATLVNCCGANLITSAMKTLSQLSRRPFGGYGNSADVVLPDERGGAGDPAVDFKILTPDRYAEAASRWMAEGATIVGGCCYTGPAHIRLLRRMIEERSDLP